MMVRQIGLTIAAGLLGWSMTGLVLAVVRHGQHVAVPTDRGLHTAPTPVGGGLGVIGAALLLWVVADWSFAPDMWRVAAAIGALAAVSWFDDRRPLPPALRLVAQAAVVGASVWYLPDDARIAPAVPLAVERAGVAVAWLWVLNLTNFMDGIDGLAGTQAVTVGLGYGLVVLLFPGSGSVVAQLPDLALLLAGAAGGYLIWNWAPARIFMGDVGSIPLGFLFGLLMLDLALRGYWPAALILPMYFVGDATATLLDRLRRGAKPWHPHREHAYQRAVLAGMSHSAVATHIAILNISLIALAVASVSAPLSALAAAALLTAAVFAWLWTRRPGNG